LPLAVRDRYRAALPPLPDPPVGVGRIALSGSYGTTRWTNVFWVRAEDIASVNFADWRAFLDDFGAAFGLAFNDVWHTDVVFDETDGTIWKTGFQLHSRLSPSVSGTFVGATSAPANVAAVVSWDIARSYRGGHPRTYLGGVAAAALQDENSFTGTYLTTLSDDAAEFLAAVNALASVGGPWHLGTLSRIRNHVAIDPPIFEEYLGAFVDSRCDTQRRRLGRS